MTTEYRIRFQIQMAPTELPYIGSWANGMTMNKELSGDFTGTSEGLFINSGQKEGMRSYIAIEKLEGQLEDGAGASVVLEHGGIENDESACFGRVVPGTGTGGFEGLTGTVNFEADDESEMIVITAN